MSEKSVPEQNPFLKLVLEIGPLAVFLGDESLAPLFR